VGAHKGAFTYWMRKAVGGTGRVFSFEPQPELAAYLSEVTEAFRFANVTVIHAGVSSAPGRMDLFRWGNAPSPGATLEPGSQRGSMEAIPVRVECLDGYFARHPGRPIRLIKCDTEGHELSVFRGAEGILREDRPVLLFECERRHHRDRQIGHVFQYLEGLGYDGFFFLAGKLRPIGEFRAEEHQVVGGRVYANNFAFLPNREAQPAFRPLRRAV
jgi:FkbM family methyltransferase